jgi:predicted DCC family thiol-disulfide oxidoreductase YuxK
VDFLISRDPGGRLRFAPLQSEWARRALPSAHSPDPASTPDSIVLLANGRLHTESTAVLLGVAALGRWYRLAGILLVIPSFLRDEIYRIVARNRYRWFGRTQSCRVPTPEERGRFLEAAPAAERETATVPEPV